MYRFVRWQLARFAILITLSAVVLGRLPFQVHAQDQRADWKTRFATELEPAWKTYAKKTAHLQGRIVHKIYEGGPEGKLALEQQNAFKQKPGHFLVLEQEVKVETNPNSVEDGILWAVNPVYGFEIRRTTLNRPWILRQLDFPLSKPPKITNASEGVTAWLSRPVSLITIHGRLPFIFNESGFKPVSFKEVDLGMQIAVRVDYTYTPDGKKPTIPAVKGYSVFLPEKYWIVREHHADLTWGIRPGLVNSVAVQMEYMDLSAEVPILKRVVQENRSKEGGKEAHLYLPTDFDLFEGNVSDEEFRLSGYGLPEPVGVNWPKTTPTYVWILIIAAVCAALAIGFRYLARRGQAATPKGGAK